MNRLVSVKRVLATKDIKRLIENFFSLSVLKLFNLILPFITLPYLIKTLGFERYGVIVLALALMQYFKALTDYGFNLSATRDIAKHRHSQIQLSYIYSKVMTAKFFLLGVSLIILLPIIFLVPHFQKDKSVFILMLLVLAGHTLFPEWFFRGMERMRYITILDLSVKLFFTAGVFLFILTPDGYWIYPLLNGIGYLAVAFLSHVLIRKRFFVFFKVVKKKSVRLTLKKSFPLFINQFAPNLYNSSTGLVVGLVLGNYYSGLFGAVRRLVDLLSVFNSVVINVLFPYLNRNLDKFRFASRVYLLSFLFLCLFFYIFSNSLLAFVGVEDGESGSILLFLTIGIFFRAVNNVYSTLYLVSAGKDRIVMMLTMICSVIGCFSLFFMVVNYGVIGGAINIATVQTALGLASVFYYIKHRVI